MFYQIRGSFAVFQRVLNEVWHLQSRGGQEQTPMYFTYAREMTEIHFPGQPEVERLFLLTAQNLAVPVTVTVQPLLYDPRFL